MEKVIFKNNIRVKWGKVRFILSTNELDENKVSNEDMLKEYNGQSKTEQGFKFIKDGTFEVD